MCAGVEGPQTTATRSKAPTLRSGPKMAMLDFDRGQRALLADKLFDAGNVAAGGMLFGQFVAGRPFSILLAGTGLTIWLGLLIVSVVLERRRP